LGSNADYMFRTLAAVHAAGMGDLGLIMPAFSQNMTGWYM
jgi:hypothetical protein